jgi:hypothetical protein
MDEIPRRCRIDLMVPAELAIRAAVETVEEMAADVRLTEAVILLGRAQERVADFVDGVKPMNTRIASPTPTTGSTAPSDSARANGERNPLQGELFDLITLMPDTQVDEILTYIATLREARARQRASASPDTAESEPRGKS